MRDYPIALVITVLHVIIQAAAAENKGESEKGKKAWGRLFVSHLVQSAN